MKTAVLRKEIVIPAGTVFRDCDCDEVWHDYDNFETTVGLTKGSSGDLVYCIDPLDKDLDDWFEIVYVNEDWEKK